MKHIHTLGKFLALSLVATYSTWLFTVNTNERTDNSFTFNIAQCPNPDLSNNLITKSHPKPKPTATPQQTAPSTGKKKLTLLIYMAGDNNLEPYINVNKRWIEQEGVDPDMNILLFICTHRANEPKLATKIVIQGHKTTIVEKINGLDSGKKETLIKACAWATEYPADETAVIMWDHGSGPLNKNKNRGICYDNTTGSFLTDTDLQEAFSTATQQYLNGKKFAFIGFDACLMGALEIASVVKPYARYMIASEHTIPATGWPYNLILKAFKSHKNALDQFITRDIVEAYQTYYDRFSQDYTLSCTDLTHIDPLIDNVNAISTTLSELLNLQKNHSVSKALSDASAETTRFDEPAYADLYDWYSKISTKTNSFVCVKPADTKRLVGQLTKLIMEGILLIKQAAVNSVQGTIFSEAHGLLIYLPENYIDKTYLTTQWVNKTVWITFLRAYLEKARSLEQARPIEQTNLPEQAYETL